MPKRSNVPRLTSKRILQTQSPPSSIAVVAQGAGSGP